MKYFQKFRIFLQNLEKTSKICKQNLQAEFASRICKQNLQAEIASRNCKQKLEVRFEFETSKIYK